MLRFLRNYRSRHRHPVNVLLHGVGLPVTFLLPVWFLVQGEGFHAALAFVGGYALQFLGHAVEGNDAGEVCALKKMMGRPYTAVAPQYATESAAETKTG